ncbi:MAG: protocatechuate 3,4-dioxygenase beta subunit [Planctomycetota bacterium]|jgi:protocatechuate 3,4-dioxygenase beta subunit
MTTQRWMLSLLGLGLVVCGLVIFVGNPAESLLARPSGLGAATPRGALPTEEVDVLPSVVATETERVGEILAVDAEVLLGLEEAQRGEATFGNLELIVRSFEDGEPLPGIRLTVETSQGRRLSRMRMLKPGPGANLGTPDDALLSNMHGQATFTVPARQALTVRAWSEDGRAQPLEKDVVKLGNLEERRVTLRLRTRLDVGLRGRVVTAEGNSPIEGARVAVQSHARGLRSSTTDAEGRYWSWAQSGTGVYLRIDRKGFTPTMIPVRSSPPRGDATEIVALRRSASIQFSVLDSTGLTVAQATCVVAVAPLDLSQGLSEPQVREESFRFEGQTNAKGQLELVDLPSGVPLWIEIRPPEGGMHPLAEPLILEPGKMTRCDFEIPGLLELRGTLSNQDGEPIVGQPLWAVRSYDTQPRFLECIDCSPEQFRGGDPKGDAIEVVTGAGGRFLFGQLLEGTYLVGPTPYCHPAASLQCQLTSNPQDVVPLGTPIRLGRGSPNHMDLILPQGLYLTGRVVNVDGKGMSGSELALRGPGHEDSNLLVSAAADGGFSIGPLSDGAWRIQAIMANLISSIATVEPRAESEREFGDEGVLLVLKSRGDIASDDSIGSISGILVNHPRLKLPQTSGVDLQRRGSNDDSASSGQGSFDQDTGAFTFKGLTPGTYVIRARNDQKVPNSRRSFSYSRPGTVYASMTVTLPPGGVDLEDVQFFVGQPAQLNLRVSDETAAGERVVKAGARSRWAYTVRSGADLVLRGVFWGTESGPIAVPEGYLDAVITEMDNDHAISRRGEATFGEPLELVF